MPQPLRGGILILLPIVSVVLCTPVIGQDLKSQSGAVFTATQAERGHALYRETCEVCHGANAEGTQFGPPVKGAVIKSRWDKRSLNDLFEYIQYFMPLNSPNGLSRQQNADILTFLLQQSGFKTGATELRPDSATLKQVIIQATDQ